MSEDSSSTTSEDILSDEDLEEENLGPQDILVQIAVAAIKDPGSFCADMVLELMKELGAEDELAMAEDMDDDDFPDVDNGDGEDNVSDDDDGEDDE